VGSELSMYGRCGRLVVRFGDRDGDCFG